jgi:APA family basic amino acid/polyamine antiporter
MARDGLFFRHVGELNKFSVPQRALWIQCLLAPIWSISGRYGDLLDMISCVAVVFYMLTIIGIFILRKTRPAAPRPYRAFGYPFFPIIYILIGLTFCILLVIYKPAYTWPGLIIVLFGVPIYYFAIRKQKTHHN